MAKSKKKSKDKKQPTRTVPLHKLGKFAEKAGYKKIVFYNKFPIRDGYSTTNYYPPEQPAPKPIIGQTITEVYEGGKSRKKVSEELEQFPNEPLDKKQKKLVQYFTGGELGGMFLGEFLRQHCNVLNPETMIWKQIITALVTFAKGNSISPEEIEQYPKTSWELRNLKKKTTDQSADAEQDVGGLKNLLQIASTVHNLVQDESKKECFQKHLITFRKLKNKFDQALKKAQEAAKADPNLRYYGDEEPEKSESQRHLPEQGWEIERFYVLKTPPKGFWRQPLPFNPDAGLQRFRCKSLGLFYPEYEEPRNKTEKLACEFALIAAIHDEALDILACDRLTDPNKDDWVELLWSYTSDRGSTYDDIAAYPERIRNINTAFEDVVNNLPDKKPVKERQEISGKAGETKKSEPPTKGFTFGKGQAFFNGKDLELPTGAEVSAVEILKKLVKSFGKVVSYKILDENSTDTASDFLRGKIRAIRISLVKHKVPYKIQSKKWTGYVLGNSRTHS